MAEPTKTFEIVLSGCDDSTVVEMDLTHDEWAVLDRFAHRTRETSQYGCQPRMSVTRKDEGSDS
jgi:hypothetical protein